MEKKITKKDVICIICARSGSKGLKDKNILKINDIPLIAYPIIQAKKSKKVGTVLVTTDSKKIAKIAKHYGAVVPFIRPKYLAKPNSPEIYSWRHAVEFLDKKLNIKPDYIVSIPTTCPLRKVSDIDECIEKAIKNNFDIVFAITPSTRNPYFNLLEEKRGKLNILSKTGLSWNFKKKTFYRRQDTPNCFDLTTACYVFKPSYIKKTLDLFSGKVGFEKIPRDRSIDIDGPFDYKLVKFLSKKK